MKRSKQIALALIASISITAGCSEKVPTSREVYKSRQACIEDWGTPEECQEDNTQRGYYHGPHYIYMGGYPYYYRTGYDDPMPVSRSAKFASVAEGSSSSLSAHRISSNISRGGFGGAFHGSSSRS